MTTGLMRAAALAACVALPMAVAAQDRPPPSGARPDSAPVPTERPAEKPAHGPQVPEAPAARPVSPAEAPTAPEAPADASAPEPQPDAAPEPEPTGPPAHTQLREDDFAFAACRMELMRLGTEYTLAAPVTGEARDCGIDRPLAVSAILPGVTLEGVPQMRCDAVRALAWWVRDFVQPAAARLPGAPRVTGMGLGSTYQCRGTVGGSTNRLSEHALGNAIDIASFTLDNGQTVPVADPKTGSGEQAFLAAVRWSACMDFATVLGPGSNAAHDNHLHLDVKARRGHYRICE